jgi:hypothetical protein
LLLIKLKFILNISKHKNKIILIKILFLKKSLFPKFTLSHLSVGRLHPKRSSNVNNLLYWLGVLNYEEDIGTYTIKVANDPQTFNRIVIYRPSKNIISQNELISLWEQKSGQKFSKTFVPEEELVKLSQSKTYFY